MSTDTLIKSTTPTIKDGTFVVDGATFAETVATVAKAIGAKPNSLLGSIQLAFLNQRVTVSATDLEVAVSIKLPIKGKKSSTVAVEAAKLVQFAKALKGETAVEIVVGSEEVLVQAGDTVFHLPPVFDFPKIEYPADVDPTELDLPAYVRAVKIAGAAASTDEARPILTGIYFHDVDGMPTAVATDSFKLAVAYDGPAGLTGLVPAAAAKLSAIVFDGDDEVTFEIAEFGKTLVLRSGMKAMKMRLIEGEFPNYAQLIRKTHDFKVLASRDQLVDALDKVRLASNGGTIPVSAVVEKGNMHLSVINLDRGSAHDDVELTSGSKNTPTVGMNPEYLVRLLKAVDSDNVQIGYADSFKPVVITDGSTAPAWKLLVMPVRVP